MKKLSFFHTPNTNKYRLIRLSGSQLIFLVLSDCEVFGVPFFQVLKHNIHGILELFIILTDLHGVDELNQRSKVLFLNRGFVVDISDQRTVQQRFRLGPELVPGLAVTLGVGNQGCDELQDVFFAVDISEGIVVHTLGEVDGVEYLHFILPDGLQRIAAFD